MKGLNNVKQPCLLVFVLLSMIVVMVIPVFQFGDINLVFAKQGYESPSRDGPNCNISNQGDHDNNTCGNPNYGG